MMQAWLQASDFPLTLATFRTRYPVAWDGALRALKRADGYGLGFSLRVRVPDGCGLFGTEHNGARWCWPWQWTRLYYEARKAASPGLFAP